MEKRLFPQLDFFFLLSTIYLNADPIPFSRPRRINGAAEKQGAIGETGQAQGRPARRPYKPGRRSNHAGWTEGKNS